MEIAKIAHISDLHFDYQKKNDSTWDRLVYQLQNFIRPDLLLVTGDIVDTPNEGLYTTTQKLLHELCEGIEPRRRGRVRYFVCAGNHDRHWRGNALPTVKAQSLLGRILGKPIGSAADQIKDMQKKNADAFDRIFQGRVPGLTSDRFFDVELGTPRNEWNLRILGLDSSIEADIFARGYVSYEEIDKVREAMKDADEIDLGILLIHHHLFPVRSLENARRGARSDLAQVTPLVNAGILTEALASSHVDIALHGHEHAANWGRYGTLEHGGGETNVIGAGSATGAATLAAFDQSRASFNVIELREDRSVGLSVYRNDGARWEPGPQFDIYDSHSLRRARFLRRARDQIQRMPESDVVRYIEATRERDWIIRETRTKVSFSQTPRIGISTRNTTGTPSDLKIELVETGWRPPGETVLEATSRENTYVYECDVPAEIATQIQTLKFSFRWLGGALLTAEELSALEPHRKGSYRSQGFEFGAIRVDGYFRELRLVISLPQELVPVGEDKDNDAVVAFVEGPESQVVPQTDVVDRLRIVGRGLYTLVVPYPRRDYLYGIKWRPPPALTLGGVAGNFADNARRKGAALSKAFHEGLADTALAGRCALTLYVADDKKISLVPVGVFPPEGSQPAPISLNNEDNLVAWAWRGVEMVAMRPETADLGSPDYGYQADEHALIAVPVRFSLSWTNDPPWGVMRIGVREMNEDVRELLGDPSKGERLRRQLLRSMIHMLAVADI